MGFAGRVGVKVISSLLWDEEFVAFSFVILFDI